MATKVSDAVPAAKKKRPAGSAPAGAGDALKLKALVDQASELSGQPEDAVRKALEELLVAFPRYRTYGAEQGMPVSDQALLDEVLALAKTRLDGDTPAVAEEIVRLLRPLFVAVRIPIQI